MPDNHPRPRWGFLYLAMPLAGLLFWLVQRAKLTGTVRNLLDIGALIVVFGYVEAWRVANAVALLHHPLPGGNGGPIYYAREVVGSVPAGSEGRLHPVFVADSGSDLSSVPGQVGEPLRPLFEPSSVEGPRDPVHT